MSYKVICIDVDGTLLGESGIIPEENILAIEQAYKKGVQVVISTGRIYSNAVQIAKRIQVKSPVIAANGAVVKDWYNGKTIFHASFTRDEYEKLLELLSKYKLVAHFYTMDRGIAYSAIGSIAALVYKMKNYSKSNKIYVDSYLTLKSLRKKLIDLEGHIVKCVLYSIDKENLRGFRKEIEDNSDMSVFGAGSYSIEIGPKGVSKGNSVKILSNYLSINIDDVICIGDNENDIEMVKYAGLGVAMGNGVDSLKEVADYVTDTNINSGVANVINKFILAKNP